MDNNSAREKNLRFHKYQVNVTLIVRALTILALLQTIQTTKNKTKTIRQMQKHTYTKIFIWYAYQLLDQLKSTFGCIFFIHFQIHQQSIESETNNNKTLKLNNRKLMKSMADV